MASTSTDLSALGAERPDDAGAEGRESRPVPLPLDARRLERVPGVLGRIARERAADYADVPWGAPDPAEGTSAGEAAAAATSVAPRAGGRFEAALRAPGLSVVAEIKRGSPSAGAIADLDPVEAADAYGRGGAAALSVLTEPRHFGGDMAHLRAVVAASPLPAMRKEFVVHPAQLREAADAGAAAVLLIAAVLGPALPAYLAHAGALGLDALVEVHDEEELDAALAAGARILGVNNRDLRTLDVDRTTAPRLLQRARDAGFRGVAVAESGYRTSADLEPVRDLADAVLVGTALAGSGDLAAALATLRGSSTDASGSA